MRRPSPLLLAAAAAAVAAGCTPKLYAEGVLRVTITLQAGTTARCVILAATPTTGTARSTEPMTVGGKSELLVAVYQGDMGADVALVATGYSDDGCTTPVDPPERGSASATFKPGQIVDAAINLTPTGPDGDGDGYPTPADCDDGNRDIHPGATERCGDGRDNDCDGQTDCADSACAGLSCAPDGGPDQAVCASGSCGEVNCVDGLDNDGDQLVDCQDPSCDLRGCRNQGLCQNLACDAGVETGLCWDGIDNDHDNLTDCADQDCSGFPCSADLCRPNDVCNGGSCTPGAPLSCSTPGNLQCQADAGICSAGQCFYAALDAGCNDSLACTVVDRCNRDGGCAGSVKACNSPPFALGCEAAPMPLCNEADGGSCDYLVDLAGTCTDSQACTVSDHCLEDGGCGGTVSCSTPPAPECFVSPGTCGDAGACTYPVTSGASCNGGLGTCNSVGTCVSPFPYITSNFNPATLVGLVDGGVNFAPGCADTTINSSGAVTISGSGGGCSAPVLPPKQFLTPDGGVEVVVFAVDSFTLASGRNLHLTGSRLVIWAVFGDAGIAGTITVDAGADSFGCLEATSGTTAESNRSGGGGGGAYGLDGGSGGTPPGAFDGGVGRGGAASGAPELIPLRGGCRGGDGGSAWNGAFGTTQYTSGPGPGGSGGGGLQLSVAGFLSLTGTITAPGQGGTGGFNGGFGDDFGGGGGGSGGAILLEASTLTFGSTARLAANGGSGGEGYAATANGANGVAGTTGAGQATTIGLASNDAGGDPGLGGARSGPATDGVGGPDAPSSRGGGGGGGSVGRIRLNALTTCTSDTAGVIISPAHTSGGTATCP